MIDSLSIVVLGYCIFLRFWQLLPVTVLDCIYKGFLFLHLFHLKDDFGKFVLYLLVLLLHRFSLGFYLYCFDYPVRKLLCKTLCEYFKVIAWNRLLKNIEWFCVKYHYFITISYKDKFVFFYELTKCDLLILKSKRIALNPFVFCNDLFCLT